MDKVKQNEELWSHFITPEQAMEFANDESLLVVVDTHKPSMVMEQNCYKIENVVVIDHHRRGKILLKTHCWFIWNHMLLQRQNWLQNYLSINLKI